MSTRICLLVYLALFIDLPLAAAPTGQQLLQACERALTDGYRGLDASMCEWYVTPCDCDVTKQKEQRPRVCLPANVSGKLLARKVIKGIRSEPGLSGKSAAYAAAVVLSRSYPCPD